MSDVVFQLDDSKGRPLITGRDNGLTSFYRYADMDEESKDVVLKFFAALNKQGQLAETSDNKKIDDIAAYLDYKTEEDFCG